MNYISLSLIIHYYQLTRVFEKIIIIRTKYLFLCGQSAIRNINHAFINQKQQNFILYAAGLKRDHRDRVIYQWIFTMISIVLVHTNQC